MVESFAHRPARREEPRVRADWLPMRVLFTSVSALGHVRPMVPLVLALIERGHQVRWLTGPDAVGRLGAVGIAADPVGPPFEALRAEYRRRYPEAAAYGGEGLADHVFPRLFGEVAAGVMFPEVMEVTPGMAAGARHP